MHPVLRRTGELSKLRLSDLLPSATQGRTKRQRSDSAHYRKGDLGARGLSQSMDMIHLTPSRGNLLQELLHTLFNSFLRPFSSVLGGGVLDRRRMVFALWWFLPASSRGLLPGNFRQNVARSFSHPVGFSRRGGTGSRQLSAMMRCG